MEILLSPDTSANITISIKNVVIAFSEDGFGAGIFELAKDSLLGLLAVYCPGTSFASVAVGAARQGLKMGDYHENMYQRLIM